MTDYYTAPPSFGGMMKRQMADKISLEDSVRQNISLYLATKPGEYHYDPEYGCIIHHYDFRMLTETPGKDQIKRSIEAYLKKFDKRIEPEQVNLEVVDAEERIEGKNPRMCRFIQITVICRLISTREKLPEMKFRVVRYS